MNQAKLLLNYKEISVPSVRKLCALRGKKETTELAEKPQRTQRKI